MKTIKEFVVKRFLSNSPYETGSVSAWASISTYHDEEEKPVYRVQNELTAELVIKDCYKTVTLDFYADNEKIQKERLGKLDVLISTLTEFRENLPIVYEEYNNLERERKEMKKDLDQENQKD